MDIEKHRRAALIERLGPTFHCFQEVGLRHAVFPDISIKADVVAVALDGMFAGVPLAFEVKEPAPDWQSKRWIHSLRQAADYVFASIERLPLGASSDLVGRRVAAAFVYPAKPIKDYGLDDGTDPMMGAVTLALHFRVGQARPSRTKTNRFALAFANNEIWRSDIGFGTAAVQFLDGRYRVGSRQINALDLLSEGDG